MFLFYVIGQIFNNRDLCGYRVIDVANRIVKDVNIDFIDRLYSTSQGKFEFVNATYKKSARVLIGTQGSLTNYQSLYTNGVLFGKKKVTVLYKIKSKDTNKVVGYGICDGYGMILNVRVEKLVELCSKYEPANFDFKINRNGENIVVPLGETKFLSYTMNDDFKAIKGYNSKLGETNSSKNSSCSEIKVSNHSNMLPTVNIYSFDDIKSSEFASKAQDRMFQAYSNLKKLSPYYHTLVMNVKRVASKAVPTLGVTEDTMYYNIDFVATQKVSELTYILIHEVDHMAMRHAARHGDRDNELWNIATDLYINSIISRDFNCYFGEGEVEVDTPLGKAYIKVPEEGIHLSTIGETLDFGNDTPEVIYDRLVKENKFNDTQSGKGDGNGSKGKQGKSNSKQGNSSSSMSSDDSSNGDQNSDSENSNNSSNENSPLENNGTNVSKDKSKLNEDGVDVDQSNDYNSVSKNVSVTYNGKKLTGKISMDIMTNEIGDSKERNERMEGKSLETTQAMKTSVEVAEQKLGETLMKNAGLGQGLIRRCIEFGLSTLVNWRVLLANMCKSKPKKMYTLASPNEVYMNSGVTVASRRKIGKPTAITGIKICIDVSGSVSEKELQYYLSEVNNILNHYEVEGELIYWSTMVGDAGNFSDLRGMLKVNPVSSGGTDVKCVFDYLAGKTRVNSKYEPTSLKDISCIIIFTDGCFASNYKEYAKYFAKKTIWVIPDSKFTFSPCFGKVATMD